MSKVKAPLRHAARVAWARSYQSLHGSIPPHFMGEHQVTCEVGLRVWREIDAEISNT
jgi:hypothetical protein